LFPKLKFQLKQNFLYKKEVFLLGTGADITMLPHRARELFDEPFDDCNQLLYGIEGTGISILKSKIKMKICERETDFRCIFSQKDNIPIILGTFIFFMKKFF
jgi:hypothetical protein